MALLWEAIILSIARCALENESWNDPARITSVICCGLLVDCLA